MSHSLAIILALVIGHVAMLGCGGVLFWMFFTSEPYDPDGPETHEDERDDDGGGTKIKPPIGPQPRSGDPIRWRDRHGPGQVASPSRTRSPLRDLPARQPHPEHEKIEA